MRTARAVLAVLGGCLLLLAGCAGAPEDPAGGGDRAAGGAEPIRGDVTVLAAASLTEAFTEIGRRFEASHPGVTVRFSFAGSSTLAQQVLQGAPADVFASANRQQMRLVADQGLLAGEPVVVARNTLQIAVPAGNPGDVQGLADLGAPDATVALCAPQVPCGAAARRAFEAAGVEPAPDTLEQDVKAVLTKVRLGEVDAGLVYVSDVVAAGPGVRGIDFPEAPRAVNAYTVALLEEAPNAPAARAFLEYVVDPEGQRVLARHGFRTGDA